MKLQRSKRLLVYPNPWGVTPAEAAHGRAPHVTVDAEGRFCGVTPMDPMSDGGEPGRLVGATHDAVFLTDPKKGDIRNPRQSTGYVFLGVPNRETVPHQLADELAKRDPVQLKDTDYYRDRIREGALLPADAQTAAALGLPFVDPKLLFRRLSQVAAGELNARFDGEDAYGHFISERAALAQTPAPDPQPKAPPAPSDTKPAEDAPKKAPPESK